MIARSEPFCFETAVAQELPLSEWATVVAIAIATKAAANGFMETANV